MTTIREITRRVAQEFRIPLPDIYRRRVPRVPRTRHALAKSAIVLIVDRVRLNGDGLRQSWSRGQINDLRTQGRHYLEHGGGSYSWARYAQFIESTIDELNYLHDARAHVTPRPVADASQVNDGQARTKDDVRAVP